jgi:hypothetical protein
MNSTRQGRRTSNNHECCAHCCGQFHVDTAIEPKDFLAAEPQYLIDHYAETYSHQGMLVVAVRPARWVGSTTDSDSVAIVFIEIP